MTFTAFKTFESNISIKFGFLSAAVWHLVYTTMYVHLKKKIFDKFWTVHLHLMCHQKLLFFFLYIYVRGSYSIAQVTDGDANDTFSTTFYLFIVFIVSNIFLFLYENLNKWVKVFKMNYWLFCCHGKCRKKNNLKKIICDAQWWLS